MKNKKKAIAGMACGVVAVCAAISVALFAPQKTSTEEMSDNALMYASYDVVSDYKFPEFPYLQAGYANLMDYWNDLIAKRNEAIGVAQEAIDAYADVITDEQKQSLNDIELEMTSADDIDKYNTYLAEFNSVTDELNVSLEELIASMAPPVSYGNGIGGNGGGGGGEYVGSGYSSGGGGLTESGGVFYYNGRKETYYSQRVLPGGGLNIPGRHVYSDGTIRDADGYIVVAASDLPYGSTVDTSLGAGKVYDTGCSSGITDIYTDW